MSNKIVLITGATSGIGKATAISLAKKDYEIVFVARNQQKAEKVKEEIVFHSKNNNVDFIIADFTSLKQVKLCAEKFKQLYPRLDILINNAGVCLPEKRITEDGFEESFQINYLSHFMLTNLLLDEIKKSEDGRIVNVTSKAYQSGKFDLSNLGSERKFSTMGSYADSKLYNILFSFELAERLKNKGVSVNALHPGLVKTNFGNELKGFFKVILFLFSPFMLSPEKGAATSVYVATCEDIKGMTGKYFEKSKPVEIKSPYITPEIQKILWKKSEELCRLK